MLMATKKLQSAIHPKLPAVDPWQVVSTFAPYLRIAHHIGGRVRLKLAAAALDEPALKAFGSDRLKDALTSIRGVQGISLNLLARSCLVEYDNSTIPDAAWPDLLAQRQSAAATKLLDRLAAAATAANTSPCPSPKEKTP